ncbi:hypothetical protein BJ741DRAFT_593900 [Chytriomyces cf. hyalinus JEL632]|nr:hypothetical protein BJ741DRAFT_593900 [Chytriomyces cf. hyalinus JEL632]
MLYLQLACVCLAALSHAMPAGLAARQSSELSENSSSGENISSDGFPINSLGGSGSEEELLGENEIVGSEGEGEVRLNEEGPIRSINSNSNSEESRLNEELIRNGESGQIVRESGSRIFEGEGSSSPSIIRGENSGAVDREGRILVNGGQNSIESSEIGSELDNLEYVNGFQFGGRMVLDSNFINELSSSFPGMNYVSVGNVINDLTRLRMRTNLMEGCRRISQQRRIKLIVVVRIANSCMRRMQVRRVRVNSHPMVIFRTIGHGMLRPRVVRTQTQRVVRVVIVQRVQTRIQNVCRTLRISPEIGSRCVQRILVNMGSWGCCGNSISSNRESNSNRILLSGRDTTTDIDVNSTEIQTMALDMIEGLQNSITKLSGMTEEGAMEWSTGFAKEMKVPQEMVSNIASELINSMMEGNAVTGEAFDAMSNVALAKMDVMAEPMADGMMMAAEEMPTAEEMAAAEKADAAPKAAPAAPVKEKKPVEEVKPTTAAAEVKTEEKKAAATTEEAKPQEKAADANAEQMMANMNRNAAVPAAAMDSTTMSMMPKATESTMAMQANLLSGSFKVATSAAAAVVAFMLF